MKRRHFIKTSVGAGIVLSSPHDLIAAFERRHVLAGKTLYDKIWDAHVVAELGGITSLLHVDRLIIADGGPNSIRQIMEEGLTIVSPELAWTVPDHSVSTSPDRYTNRSLNQGDAWRSFVDMEEALRELGVHAFGIDDPRHGIQHVVGPETGLTQPGMIVVAGDSHTCTHGAVGCVSWGGEADRNVLLTGTVIRERARNFRINFTGTRGPWIQGKDLILHAIGTFGADAGNRCAVEYAGPVIQAMTVEDRLTMCNLSIEMGAATGMVGPDDTTYQFMAEREFRPQGRYWEQALAYWRTLPTDADAVFDRDETLDISNLAPQVTWGVSPEHTIPINGRIPDPAQAPAAKQAAYRAALDYTKLTPGQPIAGTPVDEVFIGSCSESRISDLRAAARVVEGRRVAESVEVAWVVPGSLPIKRQAEAEGLDRIFKAAGFEWREPGCSKCYGSNGDLVGSGKRCISNSNRNYIGRQGIDAITHLASTPMVAAAAIAGRIVDVRRLVAGELV